MTTIETQLVALRDLADAGLPVHEATRVRLTKAFRLKTFYRCPRCDANSTEVFRHPNGTNTFNCWGCMFKFEWTDMLTEDGSGDDLILIIVDAAIAAEAGMTAQETQRSPEATTDSTEAAVERVRNAAALIQSAYSCELPAKDKAKLVARRWNEHTQITYIELKAAYARGVKAARDAVDPLCPVGCQQVIDTLEA